ncbi:MAG: OsmC family protein [Candidatus Margulisbacteria bacterium]|nr:OsmC family protein [Candidatus Margulisiibacteriota bacterium]
MRITTHYKDGLQFKSINDEQKSVIMDAHPEVGGAGEGMTPKELLLAGLCGCTGIDVVSILKKMRQNIDEFYITADADEAEEHPKIFTNVRLEYHLKGKNLGREQVEKAVQLSQEKYCSVSAMFKTFADLSYTIFLD